MPKTTVKVDKELVREAHELGLNVSKICENALKEAIRRLKAEDPKIEDKGWSRGQDLNLRHSPFLICGTKSSDFGEKRIENTQNVRIIGDLEDFRLFAKVKLNLAERTVDQYVRWIRAFLRGREFVSDRDIQEYIREKMERYSSYHVSNLISAFKAYFRDFKGLPFMDGYKHPRHPLRIKEEIEPEKVKSFIEAIKNVGVKCIALFLASSGLRKSEVLTLKKSDVNRNLRCIIPKCHSGQTKRSGISFYNEEAERLLEEFEKIQTSRQKRSQKLFPISWTTFIKEWRRAKRRSKVNLKPKDLRDFFSQEMGKRFVPDRYIDIFQGRAPRNILAKHYTPQGIKMLKEIYDRADLKILR
jgi:integrase